MENRVVGFVVPVHTIKIIFIAVEILTHEIPFDLAKSCWPFWIVVEVLLVVMIVIVVSVIIVVANRIQRNGI